jgi:D-3-phosphoglycerate dehydrogenase
LVILNLEPSGYSSQARSILKSLGEIIDGPLSRNELLIELPNVDVLIVRLGQNIDREILSQGDRLRTIVSATTGLDHIDLEAAREKGIQILSLRGETDFLRSIPATAEHTWALLLAVRRHVVAAQSAATRGDWNRDKFRGRELRNATIGLLGLGRVGRQVAEYARAFGMQVVAYDPHVDDWPAVVTRARTMAEMLRSAEILSIHIPLTAETHGLMDSKHLALMPEGATLINTSRGEIVDEDALVDALASGRVAAAGLDTICDERNREKRENGRLLAYARDHDHLLITPHIGGATIESMARTELFMAEKLARLVLSGAHPD